MKSFITFLKESDITSDYHQQQLNHLGRQAFNWHLADRQANYHVGQIKALEAEYGGRGTSTHHYLEMKQRMSPEDRKMHDFHDQQNAHHNKEMRTTHRHDDAVEHMKEDGIDEDKVNTTLTLAKELARSVPITSANSFNDSSRRLRDILGSVEESLEVITEESEETESSKDYHVRLGQAAFAMHTHAALAERHGDHHDRIHAESGDSPSEEQTKQIEHHENKMTHHGEQMLKYYDVLNRMKGNRKNWTSKEQGIINISHGLVDIVHGVDRDNKIDPGMSSRFYKIMGEVSEGCATDNTSWEEYKRKNAEFALKKKKKHPFMKRKGEC